MKFDTKQFAPTPTLPTRPNEAWAIDFAMLDQDRRALVMMVVDVGTRRPLSATVCLPIVDDVVATMRRLVRRSGRPQEVWLDAGFRADPMLQAWAREHSVLLVYTPAGLPRMNNPAERILHHLASFLHGRCFPELMELGHEIERWRQSYKTAVRTIPEVNQ
ncbi:DDE-type integrase/transposase/recombinase [Bradyrhizobium guangzhouense]|uniref:Integrase catalytic domain-containing protein n=1 Tax=Bradyrhizobium guangzhouense TaxID=1325095 RepID=A0AAE6CAQ0_9BRAD|nr:DDE-type integrase/transposase/recombinase [Bradyrhizobium guangzhouense]QAU48852.1 hypothetical protein XH91_28180 [Bradyrhizobium guangzhouense]